MDVELNITIRILHSLAKTIRPNVNLTMTWPSRESCYSTVIPLPVLLRSCYPDGLCLRHAKDKESAGYTWRAAQETPAQSLGTAMMRHLFFDRCNANLPPICEWRIEQTLVNPSRSLGIHIS